MLNVVTFRQGRTQSRTKHSFCWDCPSCATKKWWWQDCCHAKIYLVEVKALMLNWQKSDAIDRIWPRLFQISQLTAFLSELTKMTMAEVRLGGPTRVWLRAKAHWSWWRPGTSDCERKVTELASFFYAGALGSFGILQPYVGWAWQGRLYWSHHAYMVNHDSMFGTGHPKIQGRYFWIER